MRKSLHITPRIITGVVTWIVLVVFLANHELFLAVIAGLYLVMLMIPNREEGSREMPIAVVGQPKRYDLKTLPPDGYVIIRRLTHGEKNIRRAMSSKMTMKTSKGRKDVDTIIDAFNASVNTYNFQHCIVEHNCQDTDGRTLDFSNPMDLAKLDGKVSEEIETYIDQENNFEDDDDLGNSLAPSEATS